MDKAEALQLLSFLSSPLGPGRSPYRTSPSPALEPSFGVGRESPSDSVCFHRWMHRGWQLPLRAEGLRV